MCDPVLVSCTGSLKKSLAQHAGDGGQAVGEAFGVVSRAYISTLMNNLRLYSYRSRLLPGLLAGERRDADTAYRRTVPLPQFQVAAFGDRSAAEWLCIDIIAKSTMKEHHCAAITSLNRVVAPASTHNTPIPRAIPALGTAVAS